MTQLEQRLTALVVALAACALCAGASVPGSRTARAAASAHQRGLDEARAAARGRLIENLEGLSEWCGKKKLYASRVQVYEALLHFDPEHTVALRGLGYQRDRDGQWLPPKKPKAPRDWDKAAAREFPAKRAEVVVGYREEMLGLLEEFAEGLDEATRDAVYADILSADPDDARVRELRGEQQVDGVWVLVETARGKLGRQRLHGLVAKAFADVPEPLRAEPDERERAFGIEWKAVFTTPGVRSIGTGEDAEIANVARALCAARAYFNAALGAEAEYADPTTVFTLPRAADKLAFLMGHPAIDGEYRKFLLKLDGSGIRGSGDLAHWGPDDRRRLDGLVRQGIGWLFADGYEIGPQQGWIFEGFGLYMTRELVGTRLTWFVRESKYLTPEEDQALKARLMDSRANWMEEAHKLFGLDKPVKLQFLLGKNVNKLTTEDMLYSYVLAAFLLEGEAERLPSLLREIGSGSTSQAAFQHVLGLDVRHLDLRVRRWLSERR